MLMNQTQCAIFEGKIHLKIFFYLILILKRIFRAFSTKKFNQGMDAKIPKLQPLGPL